MWRAPLIRVSHGHNLRPARLPGNVPIVAEVSVARGVNEDDTVKLCASRFVRMSDDSLRTRYSSHQVLEVLAGSIAAIVSVPLSDDGPRQQLRVRIPD